MKINFVRLFILYITLVSCKQTNKENFRPVAFSQYQIWLANLDTVDLKSSFTLYLDSIRTNKKTDYFLRNFPNSDSSILFSYSIKGDSLFYQGVYCNVVDTFDLDYKGKQITLYRSNFDTPNTVDEEGFIFWNHKYGLFGEYNYNMGPLLLFDHPEIPNFAKGNLYKYIVNKERGSIATMHCEKRLDTLTNREIYYNVDVQADVIGGLSKLYSELGRSNLPKDPDIDQLKIFIYFTVESNGDITDLRAICKTQSKTLNNELLQLFRKYKWEPGTCKGTKVPTKMVLVVKS